MKAFLLQWRERFDKKKQPTKKKKQQQKNHEFHFRCICSIYSSRWTMNHNVFIMALLPLHHVSVSSLQVFFFHHRKDLSEVKVWSDTRKLLVYSHWTAPQDTKRAGVWVITFPHCFIFTFQPRVDKRSEDAGTEQTGNRTDENCALNSSSRSFHLPKAPSRCMKKAQALGNFSSKSNLT